MDGWPGGIVGLEWRREGAVAMEAVGRRRRPEPDRDPGRESVCPPARDSSRRTAAQLKARIRMNTGGLDSLAEGQRTRRSEER